MEKQRKFLLVLPVLVIPFLTMAFWALGGGRIPRGHQLRGKGLDISLPEARFNKEQKQDKLSVYQTHHDDSSADGVSPSFITALGIKQPRRDSATLRIAAETSTADENTKLIQAKLAAINRQLSRPAQPASYQADAGEEETRQHVHQLRRMMQTVRTDPSGDPEMRQLSNMLTQIQAIQNPALIKAPKKNVDNSPFRALPAVIDGKQKVMDGGVVRLVLVDTATIKNEILPKGQLLYGACRITNQRLLLTIESIRVDKKIIPVNLTVYSLDGMPGIPAPEAELGGVAGTGADDAVQNMQFLSMDQSLGAQAAAGGINAAKGFFSKKVKKIKVKLKDQYPVLLKINH